MSYTTYTCSEVSLDCDNCGDGLVERTGDRVFTLSKLFTLLRSEGWRIGNKTLCPECSGKKV